MSYEALPARGPVAPNPESAATTQRGLRAWRGEQQIPAGRAGADDVAGVAGDANPPNGGSMMASDDMDVF